MQGIVRVWRIVVFAAGTCMTCGLCVALPASAVRQGDNLSWNFEDGMQGWRGDGLAVDSAVSRKALRIPVHFPRDAVMHVALDNGVPGSGDLTFRLYVPDDAPSRIQALIYMKDKDGLWYQMRLEQAFRTGAWNRVEVPFSSATHQVHALERSVTWDAYLASRIRELGLKFYCDRPFRGALLLDDVACRSRDGCASLAVIDFRAFHNEVPKYDTYECAFRVNRDFRNPFDPDEVKIDAHVIAPSGRVLRMPAFYYQDFEREKLFGREVLMPVGEPHWRIRFTPVEPGPYTFRIHIDHGHERFQSSPLQFVCTESGARGFVRISRRDPRYLEFDNGEFFYPVGQNIHSATDPRSADVMEIPLPIDTGTYAYDDLMEKMSLHGENFMEIWMSSWWLGLEWHPEQRGYQGLGRYNLEHAWKLDYMMTTAKKRGIYFHLTMDNHGKLSSRRDQEWRYNPYNRANGGMLVSPNQFFTDDRAKAYYQKRLRYIVGRWACYPQIMGFEFWSEVDLTGNGRNGRSFRSRRDKQDWHRDMARFLKRMDPWKHLVTTHFAGNFKTVDQALMSRREMDYVAFNAYTLRRGTLVGLIETSSRNMDAMYKPGLITEYGGAWYGATPSELEADVHAGLWACFMTNLAGGPMFWWTDYVSMYHAYPHYRAFSKFILGEDKRAGNFKMRTARIEDGSAYGIKNMVLANETKLYAWVYSEDAMMRMPEIPHEIPEGVEFRYKALQPGRYGVEYWDTVAGTIMATTVIDVNHTGELLLSLPAFRNDLAIKLARVQVGGSRLREPLSSSFSES